MIRYAAYEVAAGHVAPVLLDSGQDVEKARSVIEEAVGRDERAIQTDVPARAGRPRSRLADLATRGEHREKSGLAPGSAGCCKTRTGRYVSLPRSPSSWPSP
jgi:hypothetical protein